MAIDSAAKRRSVANIGLQVAPSVTPDSDKDGPWRQTVGWSYYGIEAGASAVILGTLNAYIVDPERGASIVFKRDAAMVDPERNANIEG